MKTYVVRNPLVATRTIKAGQMVTGKTRTTRRRRANPPTVLFANPSRRKRRRNPANPLILPNRRMRRRRNPFGYTPATSFKQFLNVAGQGLGGSFLAYLGDRMLFQKLGVSETGQDTTGGILFRNAARFGVGGLAAWLFPGPFGAAVMGALGYPIMGSLEAWWRGNAASSNPDTTTEADLNAELHDIEAELSDILEAA